LFGRLGDPGQPLRLFHRVSGGLRASYYANAQHQGGN
jgi:hypothetical protein